jgi:hypothetical protein
MPLPFNEPVRHVLVYRDSSIYCKEWFDSLVKPIFDRAALDYTLCDTALLSEQLENTMENAVKFYIQKSTPRKSSWLGWWSASAQPPPLIPEKPLYDPQEAIIAIGPNAWSALVDTLARVKSKPDFDLIEQFPILGRVSGKDLTGWKTIPLRMFEFFFTRNKVQTVGNEALAIVLEKTTSLDNKDGMDPDLLQKLKVYCD